MPLSLLKNRVVLSPMTGVPGGGRVEALEQPSAPPMAVSSPRNAFFLLLRIFFFVAYKVELMAFPDTLQSDKAASTREAQMNFNARWKH